MTKQKPPPITVGVSGIASAKQTTAEDLERRAIDWHHIVGLPAFQMFAAERTKKNPNDFEGWVDQFLRDSNQSIGADALYKHYSEWHKAKGYWPNECPMGKLRSE